MERQTQNNGRVVDIEKPTVKMIMQSDTLFKNNSQVSLKGIVEQSKISEIFFSEENIDVIQQTIRFQIFKRTNKIDVTINDRIISSNRGTRNCYCG